MWKREEASPFVSAGITEFFWTTNNRARVPGRHAFTHGRERIDLESPRRFSMVRASRKRGEREAKKQSCARTKSTLAPEPLNTGANGKNRPEWEASSHLVIVRETRLGGLSSFHPLSLSLFLLHSLILFPAPETTITVMITRNGEKNDEPCWKESRRMVIILKTATC